MSIRTLKFSFALVTAILVYIPLFGQNTPVLAISASGKSIDIKYNGKTRLAGGIPLIQNKNLPVTSVSSLEQSFEFKFSGKKIAVSFFKAAHANVVGIYLNSKDLAATKGTDFSGFFFSQIPDYKEGVAFWRYKPWNSWTKPVKVPSPDQLESWDNQFYYWQYQDGTYGAAVPLYGNGYRTTIGSEQGKFGSKAVSYLDGHQSDKIPAMAVGFGNDPYLLMTQLFESAMTFAGTRENLVKNKTFPEALEYLGWCTWNASANGKNLNEETVLKGVETFTKNNFPLGWLLVDDGWFNHQNSQLRSMYPDPVKFPHGFKPLIDKLKNTHHLKHVGVWHALNGLWNGIDPTSELGQQYKNEMFSWKQSKRADLADSPEVSYSFIKPFSDSLKGFFNNWHCYLKNEGFTFIKVDNQLVVEKMSPGNYPISVLATAMHQAVNESAEKYFNQAMINCMDMTADAFYNFGSTAVARSVEDYFPYEEGETYNLQRGNAAAHVLQGVYNNLYFSQMVYPDLDMFQSHHPNAAFHAVARAINNGPIYITDIAGKQNFDILKKLVYSNGRIIRADRPLLPTQDCLFQVQDKKPFKGFSQSNGIGLLGVWNCADAEEVKGEISPSDIYNLKGQNFAVYEHLSGALKIVNARDKLPVTLKRLGFQLYYMAPLQHGIAPLGLLNKYNAPATIAAYQIEKDKLEVTVKDAGLFGAVLPRRPKSVVVGGVEQKDFTYADGLMKLNIKKDLTESLIKIAIRI